VVLVTLCPKPVELIDGLHCLPHQSSSKSELKIASCFAISYSAHTWASFSFCTAYSPEIKFLVILISDFFAKVHAMFSCCSTVPCAQVNCERHQGFTLTSSSPQCMYVKVTLMTCFCKGLRKKKNSDALKIKLFCYSLVCLHLISFFLNVLECYYKCCPY